MTNETQKLEAAIEGLGGIEFSETGNPAYMQCTIFVRDNHVTIRKALQDQLAIAMGEKVKPLYVSELTAEHHPLRLQAAQEESA